MLQARSRQVAQGLGVVLAMLGGAVALAWLFDVRFLQDLGARDASMKPLTASGILLGGLALALRVKPPRGGWRQRAGLASAWLMLGVGVACLGMRILGWGADPFAGYHATGASALLFRPSWATATCLTLGALALLTLGSSRHGVALACHGATLAVGFIAAVALVGYALGVADLFLFPAYTTTALHTAASLFILCVGLCLADPRRWVVAQLLRDDAGGAVARRLLPVVIGMPLAIGLMIQELIDGRLLGAHLGLGSLVVLVAGVGVFAVATTARTLSVADSLRRDSERRIRIMLAELDHRVKNTMAAVLSICEQTAVGARSIDEFKRTYRGRLQAMAKAHDALAATKWQGVSLAQIVNTIVGAYAFTDGRALQTEGEDIVLPSSAALPLAVTLNELATNAVKHGAWSSPTALGKVRVTWRVTASDQLELNWEESDGPIPQGFPNGGFGVALIRGIIPHDVGGTVGLHTGDAGILCEVKMSLGEARAKSEARYSYAG